MLKCAKLYLANIPEAEYRTLPIGGILQECVVVPTKRMFKDKYNQPFYPAMLFHAPENYGDIDFFLFPRAMKSFCCELSWVDLSKKKIGVVFSGEPTGYVPVRTTTRNQADKIRTKGKLFLDRIPDNAICRDEETGERYVNVLFSSTPKVSSKLTSFKMYFVPPKKTARVLSARTIGYFHDTIHDPYDPKNEYAQEQREQMLQKKAEKFRPLNEDIDFNGYKF